MTAGEVRVIGSEPQDEVSLLDVLDHVLNAGVVIHGSLVISLAGVDLVYVGLNVVLTSVETAMRQLNNSRRSPVAGRQHPLPGK